MQVRIDKHSDINISYSGFSNGELVIDIPNSSIQDLLLAIEESVEQKHRAKLRNTPLGEINETIRLLNGND